MTKQQGQQQVRGPECALELDQDRDRDHQLHQIQQHQHPPQHQYQINHVQNHVQNHINHHHHHPQQYQLQLQHQHHHLTQQTTHRYYLDQTEKKPTRSIEELESLIKDVNFDRNSLTNEELIRLVKRQLVSVYKLENFLGKDNAHRCVQIRRDFYRLELLEMDRLNSSSVASMYNLPGERARALELDAHELEYEKVNGACCENVIGHVKIPVGLAGPLILDGEEIFVPLATTEGCLVASTCRGLSALRKSGGVTSRVRRDFMTRAPIVRFRDPQLRDAIDNVERAIAWLEAPANRAKMRSAFNRTSRHGRFLKYTMHPVNREIHIRFEAETGDAMGMNMCSKGVESALSELQRAFPTMEIVTLSGNMCTDKKAAGINWINGRGKSVECNAEIPAQIVEKVFKVSVDSMIDRWKSKVMVGSALAASMGGFNSQAANILTAIFIATGQDPAQNVTSSNCMFILEKDSRGSLVVCCSMPSIECGTVGGGTILADQSRYLQLMGVRGPTTRRPQRPIRVQQNGGGDTISTADLDNQQQQQRQGQPNDKAIEQPHNKTMLVANGTSHRATQQQQTQQTEANNNNSNRKQNQIVADEDMNNNAWSSTTMLDEQHQEQEHEEERKDCLTDEISSYGSNQYTNARKLARIVCATVMAGELSLLAALTEGTLVKSHMRHNRSATNVVGQTNGANINSNSSTNNKSPISHADGSQTPVGCDYYQNNINTNHY